MSAWLCGFVSFYILEAHGAAYDLSEKMSAWLCGFVSFYRLRFQ
ncbi:6679_t:CDS:2 [Entrophospora sp. SA101]|nr:6679_t:CDS:2 [Entrophospora sp. SA101]